MARVIKFEDTLKDFKKPVKEKPPTIIQQLSERIVKLEHIHIIQGATIRALQARLHALETAGDQE